MISFIKSIIQKFSVFFSVFRFVPYRLRLGKQYSIHTNLITDYEKLSHSEKRDFHFKKLKNLIDYAYTYNSFYKSFYDENDFKPCDFKRLEDFHKVPVVTKEALKSFCLNSRSSYSFSSFKVNTGGTSGEPLDFYLDKNAFAREWAYMHKIWSKFGYTFLDTKLSFRGKSNKGTPLKYNVVHNEYIVDAYVSYTHIVSALINLPKKTKIKYLHGYPSSIYAFCKFLNDNNINASNLFNNNLRGVFFGSEYPAPLYRELIEDILGVETVSWYGHSEMSVLAYEKNEHFTYFPFQTYGYTEVLPCDNGEGRLIGTSYYNLNSPFIRYDTGDLVTNEDYLNGILQSFKISSGRIGDFILDKNNNPISLTALIFGRHHDAFNVIDFLQIKQPTIGKAILCITSNDVISLDLFDLEHVDIEFSIEILDKPYKTRSGKVPLLIL